MLLLAGGLLLALVAAGCRSVDSGSAGGDSEPPSVTMPAVDPAQLLEGSGTVLDDGSGPDALPRRRRRVAPAPVRRHPARRLGLGAWSKARSPCRRDDLGRLPRRRHLRRRGLHRHGRSGHSTRRELGGLRLRDPVPVPEGGWAAPDPRTTRRRTPPARGATMAQPGLRPIWVDYAGTSAEELAGVRARSLVVVVVTGDVERQEAAIREGGRPALRRPARGPDRGRARGDPEGGGARIGQTSVSGCSGRGGEVGFPRLASSSTAGRQTVGRGSARMALLDQPAAWARDRSALDSRRSGRWSRLRRNGEGAGFPAPRVGCFVSVSGLLVCPVGPRADHRPLALRIRPVERVHREADEPGRAGGVRTVGDERGSPGRGRLEFCHMPARKKFVSGSRASTE